MEIAVKEGDRFPGLSGKTQTGADFNLDAVPTAWRVVYFYPKDDTPGCTIEANTFNGSLADFEAADATVIGVSADDAASHDAFCQKFGLSFTLVADDDAAVAKQLGIYRPIKGFEQFGSFPQRVTFLLDKDNTIRRIWEVTDIPGHPAEVLDTIRGLAERTAPPGTERP